MNIEPPRNLDAEKEFLGACFIEPKIVEECAMKPEYFYSEKHGQIFAAIQKAYNRDHDFSQLTIKEDLKLESVMPLVELVAAAKFAGLWKMNQKLIISPWKMRQMIKLGYKLLEGATEKKEFDELYAEVSNSLQAITTGNDSEIMRYFDVVNLAYKHIEERYGKGAIAGVPTGIGLLDEITDGLQDDEFTIIAARPSVGKSALAQGIAQYAASNGYPVGWVNLEMSGKQIGIRALSSKSRIPITMLKKAALQERDWSPLALAAGILADLPIFVADCAFTDRQISQAIYRMVHEKKCKLIILDYIQLMEKDESAKNKNVSREREVAGFSRLMKTTVKTLKTPIIALAQINRASETAKDKRPTIANLRESGALEADADRILLLHKPECTCGLALSCSCGYRDALEIILGKGRNDPTGTIMVEWNKETTTFGRSYRPGEVLPQPEYQERSRYAEG
jgi:replicative DNA helicase